MINLKMISAHKARIYLCRNSKHHGRPKCQTNELNAPVLFNDTVVLLAKFLSPSKISKPFFNF